MIDVPGRVLDNRHSVDQPRLLPQKFACLCRSFQDLVRGQQDRSSMKICEGFTAHPVAWDLNLDSVATLDARLRVRDLEVGGNAY